MLILVVAAIGFAANTYISDELFVLRRFAVMWIYYEIGVFIGKYAGNINFKAGWKINLSLVCLYSLLFIGFININGITGLILNVLCALTAVYIFYSLSKYNLSPVYKALSYIGRRTLYIYYIHNPYIVLITVTALTAYAGINAILAAAAAFILGCTVPLIIGEKVLNRIPGLRLILLGKKQLNLK
jgi:hypothetical protein